MPMTDENELNRTEGGADEGMVERLLEAAARRRPPMRAEFRDRLLRQAEAAAARQAEAAAPPAGAALAGRGGLVGAGVLRRWVSGAKAALAPLGGWPAMAGVLSAALVGLWLGYARPDVVQPLLGDVSELDPGEFAPDMSLILGEG